MPYVDIKTSSGPFSFCYFISTPTSYDASEITPDLPCIIFLHSGYIGQECFEFQFCDRRLREFNLISVDMRGYGLTRGRILGELPFTPVESACDLNQIMDKLALPPCHIFGLSIGCTIALELVGMSPDKVLSLTLCSPISRFESEDVTMGRLQVHQLWQAMDASKLPGPDGEFVYDAEIMAEILSGATQLLCNYSKSNGVEIVAKYAMNVAVKLWAGTPEKLVQSRKVCHEWFIKRRAVPFEALQKVKGPVSVIHCDEDVAYSIQTSEELVADIKRAGVEKVSLHEVTGSHYGIITNPQPINRILYDNVLSYYHEMINRTSPTAPIIGDDRLLTPFTMMIMQHSEFDPTEPEL